MENELEKLQKNFVTAAIGLMTCSEFDDAPGTRKFSKKLRKAFQKIRKMGELGHQLILELLNHDNWHVAISAATILLFSDTDKAKKTLEKISDNDDYYVSQEAKWRLKFYDNGKFDNDKDSFY